MYIRTWHTAVSPVATIFMCSITIIVSYIVASAIATTVATVVASTVITDDVIAVMSIVVSLLSGTNSIDASGVNGIVIIAVTAEIAILAAQYSIITTHL